MARPRDVSSGLGIFVGVLLSLQVFLLSVGVDGLLGHDARLAWTSAAVSVVLALGSVAFYRWVRAR
jgi:hypothetical protein